MFTFYYRGTDHSQALENYASSKLQEAIAKHTVNPLKLEVTFETIKTTRNTHLHFVGDQGELFELSESKPGLYECIDGLYDKLKRQLNKTKDRDISKRKIAKQPQ